MKLTRLDLKIDFARWTPELIEDMDETEDRFDMCTENCIDLFNKSCPSLRQGRVSVSIGQRNYIDLVWEQDEWGR